MASSFLFCAFDETVRSRGKSTISRKVEETGPDGKTREKTRKISLDGVCVGDTLADFAELAGSLADGVKLGEGHKDDGAKLGRTATAEAEEAKADALSLGDKGSEVAYGIMQRLKAERDRLRAEKEAAGRAEKEAAEREAFDSLVKRNDAIGGKPRSEFLSDLAAMGNRFAVAELAKAAAEHATAAQTAADKSEPAGKGGRKAK